MLLATLFSIYLTWYFQDRFSSFKTPRNFIKWLKSYFYNQPENKIIFNLLSISSNLKNCIAKNDEEAKTKAISDENDIHLMQILGHFSNPSMK